MYCIVSLSDSHDSFSFSHLQWSDWWEWQDKKDFEASRYQPVLTVEGECCFASPEQVAPSGAKLKQQLLHNIPLLLPNTYACLYSHILGMKWASCHTSFFHLPVKVVTMSIKPFVHYHVAILLSFNLILLSVLEANKRWMYLKMINAYIS